MSAPEQNRPGPLDPGGPAGPPDSWGADELDEVLADPSSAGRLGQILAAAGAPTEAGHHVGEDAARTAFRMAFPVSPTRTSRVLPRMSGRVAAAALAGGLVLCGGAAAAAAGSLPDAAQQTAKHVMAMVGVSIPGPKEHGSVHPARPGTRTQRPATTADPKATARAAEPSGTGSEVSDLAHSTASTGVAKGAAVSGAASDGKSQAGQHGKPASSTGGKSNTPTPHASKRRNGTQKPKSPAAGHTPKTNSTPHIPVPKSERR